MDLENLLRTSGLKVTGKRLAVLNCLMDSGVPVTADEIYEKTRSSGIILNLSSVYRMLEAFLSCGIVLKSSGQGVNKIGYELTARGHRHEIICLNCNTTVSIEECPLEYFEKKYAAEKGFHIVGHRIELFGYCNSCYANKLTAEGNGWVFA